MKVFIDTNILLDIYHLSGPDLEELRKLVKLVEKEKVELLISQQVLDEFWRNRERVIADAMKRFRESKASATIPNIIRSFPEAIELKAAVDKVNDIVKQLVAQAEEGIENNSLRADEIIKEFFTALKVGKITNEIILSAKRRVDIGNPPGKSGSLGDAMNWEWLLKQEIEFWDDELILISSDGDFESELTKGKPKEYLLREWNEKNHGCNLVLYKSLPDFLQKQFPDIQLAEEVDKILAIERLEESGSFAATHKAIALLSQYDDFKDIEMQRVINAYLNNGQILMILGDEDVKSFAIKIVGLAKSAESKELSLPLLKMLNQLEDNELPF